MNKDYILKKLKDEAASYLASTMCIRKKQIMQNSAFNFGISECLKYVEKHEDVLPIIAAENFASKMLDYSMNSKSQSTKLIFTVARSAAKIVEEILLNISDPEDLM